MPGEDLALPIERQVIAVFGDQDMGEEAGGGHAFGDRPLRGRRLVDGAAGPAAVARPADADDPKPRRHMVEHLADGLADRMQRAAAAGAGLLLEYRSAHPRAADAPAGSADRSATGLGRLGASMRRKRGFGPRDIGVEVFKAELQLVVIEPFGPPAELAALQLLDDELEPLDLGLRLRQSAGRARLRASAPTAAASRHRPAGRQDRCP